MSAPPSGAEMIAPPSGAEMIGRAARLARARAARRADDVAALLAERVPGARIARDGSEVTVEARGAIRRAGWIMEGLR